MKLFCRLFLLTWVCLICPSVSASDTDLLQLASLEWPPYVSLSLPAEGISASIVKAAAQLAGLHTEIQYFPWSRAVQEGLHNPAYAGYFPAFYLKEREKSCYFSGPLGNSIIGFAALKEKKFNWQKLDDLKPYLVGTVYGYANGVGFDELVKQKAIATDSAPSDISNLRKLLAHRVDVVVIDKFVLQQLLITDNSLASNKSEIVFHPKELTNFSLHICFQHNDKGHSLQKSFDSGLGKVNVKKLENLYFLQLQTKQPHQP